jgi:hypothetical protein
MTILSPRRSGPAIFALALFAVYSAPASPQEKSAKEEAAPSQSANIRLSTEQIPASPGSLPVLRLSAQKPPTEFVQEVLRRADPNAQKLVPLSQISQLAGKGGKLPEEFVGALSGEHLAAYVDLRSGDAEIFPSLAQKGVPADQEGQQLERAQGLAREIFSRADLLQKDATAFSFEKPRALYGESAEGGAEGGEAKTSSPEIYLTYVTLRRSVNNYFVYGPGSRAMVAVGNNGTVEGFVRRWKTGAVSGQVRETRTREQVAQAILEQLRPIAKTAEVEVLNTDIAYYDGNRNYLQPVYRFTARLHRRASAGGDSKAHVDDDFVIGYVPIGKAREPIPSLSALPGVPPKTAKATAPAPERAGDPTVGRYVVRNDNSNWVANANELWGGLTAFFSGFLFTDAQYFWAEPWEFTTSEAAFVNSVNVADNEVHGDWWLFSTLSNCCDLVDLTKIPASEGYGAAHGGHLAYWILHSCEVVPSAIDAPCPTDNRPWWTPWFNIFQGMHTVVGYRTIMWIDDDVTGPYGLALRFGAPVVSAWFNATTSAAGYQGNPTYGAHCGRTPPMGRPSAVSACGRQNNWVYDTTALPPANCLINFWQPN